MIEAHTLTKHYGDAVAVAGIDLVVRPGRVTGFLGPNGAGKSTTMRMILGLDRPTSGAVTVNGHAYVDLPAPLREVGALLDAHAVHPGRTARQHLRQLATSNRLPAARVDEVLDLVGLTEVADRRAGKFSLGMGQRLGIAAALIGDPAVVVLDEPVNGLDPEGDALVVRGMGATEVGDALFDAGVRVHELASRRSSLEDAFMTLTADAVQFHTAISTPEEVPA